MVWGSIDQWCILHNVSLGDIIALCDNDEAIAKLLRPQAFRPGSRTGHVASELRDGNVMINPSSAAAMGRLAACLLGSSKDVSLDHIEELVGRLVDGWGLVEDLQQDYSCALAFAKSFDSGSHEEHDVANAFIIGIKKGGDVLQFYATKRRASTHRTRNT
jgi:hypothetical protein